MNTKSKMVTDAERVPLPAGNLARSTRSQAGPQSLAPWEVVEDRCTNRGDLREFAAPKTAADLRDLLAESIVEIRAEKLDPRVATAVGYLGSSYLRALEVSVVEARLNALETNQRSVERALFQSNPADSKQEEGS